MPPPPRRRPGPSGAAPRGGRAGKPPPRDGAKGAKAKGKGRPAGDQRGRPRARDERSGDRRDDQRGERNGERRGERRDDRRDQGPKPRGRSSVPPPTGRGAAWGGLARRAAGSGGTAAPQEPVKGRLAGAGPSKAASAFAAASGRDDAGEVVEVRVELVEQDGVRGVARRAVRRGATPTPEAQPERRTRKPPAALVQELEPVVGGGAAPKLATRLADASRAFEAERFADARRILTPLARSAPESAAVRELLGLTLYRLGKWADAAKELAAFRALTASTEQHPVLADCYRAMRRYDEVDALWAELREASPSAELVAEGRIVLAGSLADRGEVSRAIAEIEPAVRRIKHAKQFHHLRLLYVLGDLYERAGDVPRARALFDRLLAADPDFGDARSRRRQI